MFFTVTDRMSGKEKVLNASQIYSVSQIADGTGAVIKFNEGGDRAKMIQTVESYESICRALFPVIPEHRDTVDEHFNVDPSSLADENS